LGDGVDLGVELLHGFERRGVGRAASAFMGAPGPSRFAIGPNDDYIWFER